MNRSLFRFLALAAISLGGCNEDDSLPTTIQPIRTPILIPLTVGNKWVRSVSLYDTSGAIFISAIDSIEVLRDSLVRGTQCYVLRMQGIEYLVANRSNGLCFVNDASDRLWFKFPAAPHDSFYVYGNTSYVRVPTTDTSVTVPAGRFNCYRYEVEGYPWVGAIGGSLDVKFISPDNGFVAHEFYSSTFTSTTRYLYSRLELTKLILK